MDPIATVDTPSTQMIPSAPPPMLTDPTMQAPVSSAHMGDQESQHRGRIASLLDSIGGALAGSNNMTISRSDDGALHIQPEPRSLGQKWAHVAATALSGAAAGLSVQNGPGNLGRAAAAGAGVGFNQAAQERQGQMDEADHDLDMRQKAQLHNGQMALLNQKVAAGTFDATQRGITSIDGMAARQNEEQNLLSSNPNNHLIGTIQSPDQLPGLLQSQPNGIQDHVNGNIHVLPKIGADGKFAGLGVYYMEKDWKDQRNPQDYNRTYLAPSDEPNGEPTLKTSVIPALGSTNGELSLLSQADSKNILDYHNKQHEQATKDANQKSEEQFRKAESARAYAEAGKAGAERRKVNTENANLQSAPGSPNAATAMRLVEHMEDPTQISMRGKAREPIFNAAENYSMDKYGDHFNPAQAQIDYKYANNTGTRNTLNYLNALVGPDGKGGNLQNLRNLSHALPRTQYPALNDVQAWARLQSGNPQVAAYHTAAVETADQFAKILQGGSGGATSDAKMKQGLELFGRGFNDQQIQSIAGTAQDLLHNRKTGIIGNNPYLLKDYMPDEYATRQAARVARKNGQQPQQSSQGAPAAAGGFNWGSHPVAQ